MSVEAQMAFNVLVTFCGFIGGWLLKMIYDRMSELTSSDRAMEKRIETMQSQFMRRDDFRDFAIDIRASLNRIEDKLDGKEDKSRGVPL